MNGEWIDRLLVDAPVIGVLVFFVRYFMKKAENELNYNKTRDKEISEILNGLKRFVEDINKKLDDKR